jgi:recombination protein RecT
MSDNALTLIKQDIAKIKPRFEAVSVDKSIVFEREASFAVQALMANEYAMRIATENRMSVINAVTNVSAIGISLNPARKQAYLVPRDGRICLDISYMGLLDIAIQSGAIRWGQAELVYANDEFLLSGVDEKPEHKRKPFDTGRGAIVGVYVVVKTVDGDYLTTTMSLDEVFKIRDRSAAWKAFIEKKKKCPWVTDEGEMIKKTVIKRAYKTWPKTERLDAAVHYLNTEGGEGLDFEDQSPLDHPPYLGLGSGRNSAPIRRMAGAALARFNVDDEPGMWGEVCEVYMEGGEELEALWKALQPFSDCRSAIKRCAEAERKGQAELEARRAEELKAA